MQSEDQYMDRTPDLIAKIRKLREAAEKEMNRFTCVADYDVRRLVSQKPNVAPETSKSAVSAEADRKPPKVPAPRRSRQSAIEFSSSPLADDGQEDV